ncbi:MAG: thiamine-phosphate kinase [Candidatus Heimdallarchaeota archaeon]
MNKKISELGERGIIELFKKYTDQGDLPFNDDAVAFGLNEKESLVINIDTFVAKTDALPNMSAMEMGAKSTVMAISDLVAKGVQPLFVLASGAFPADLSVEDTLEIVEGISNEAHNAGAKYLGGDTNEADDLVLSIVAAGVGKKDKLIKRNGAQKDDILFTTGRFGLTGAGFKVFLEGLSATEDQKKKFRRAVYKPFARLREGLLLDKFGKITSCIDSSDGLSWCLKEILRDKENLGIEIENIPIDNDVIDFAENHKLVAEDLALYAGEEFELVFTVNPIHIDEFLEFLKIEDIIAFRIGVLSEKYPGKIVYQKEDKLVEVKPKGWEHFK